MPISQNREYRAFVNFNIAEDRSVEPYIVRGYASTFEPYVMEEIDGVEYKERMSKEAFNNADISDVIFQYNHAGAVLARTKNKTLEIGTDDKGLWIKANLGTTERAKQMYEEIRTGLIDQMSFSFRVEKDHYEAETHTRVIDKLKKVYDVSAVSIPANDTTSIGISARSLFDGFIEQERQELLKAEKLARAKKALELRLRLMKEDI